MSHLVIINIYSNILFLICTIYVGAQNPPVYFKFNPTTEVANANDFLFNYEIGTLHVKGEINEELIKAYVNGEQILINGGFLLISEKYEHLVSDTYILEPVSPKVKKGDIISFHVHEKNTSKSMSIFIRTNVDLWENDVVFLKYFEFIPGIYFYDFCSTKMKDTLIMEGAFHTDKSFSYSSKIDLSCLKKNKMSISKINRLISKHNCVEP